jgi:hypothetical protein
MADGWAQFGAQPYTPDNSPTTAAQGPERPHVSTLEAQSVGGVMTAVLPPALSGGAYAVRRITVSVPAPSGYAGRAYVYVGDVRPENIVMGTNNGALDVALEDPPLFVPEQTQLSITWDAGANRALARVEYLDA